MLWPQCYRWYDRCGLSAPAGACPVSRRLQRVRVLWPDGLVGACPVAVSLQWVRVLWPDGPVGVRAVVRGRAGARVKVIRIPTVRVGVTINPRGSGIVN